MPGTIGAPNNVIPNASPPIPSSFVNVTRYPPICSRSKAPPQTQFDPVSEAVFLPSFPILYFIHLGLILLCSCNPPSPWSRSQWVSVLFNNSYLSYSPHLPSICPCLRWSLVVLCIIVHYNIVYKNPYNNLPAPESLLSLAFSSVCFRSLDAELSQRVVLDP